MEIDKGKNESDGHHETALVLIEAILVLASGFAFFELFKSGVLAAVFAA